MEIQVGVGCPKPITACSDRISVPPGSSESCLQCSYAASLYLSSVRSSLQVSCHLCLIFCTLVWTIHELGGGSPLKSTSSPGPLFCPGQSPVGFFQADSWTVWFFLSLGLRCCCLVLFPSLRILNSTVHGHHSQGCPWTLHPQQFFLVCKYEVQQIASSFSELQSPVSGSNCQHIPETYWIACVLLWC